ncbi:50S ribosomal protein L31 [Candidatus Shapirobacteria bacterium]|nr:50S ribosomal protein L31 [Candidatus Shapirobacteria bacterium]
MKKNIHPTYYPNAKVTCACGNTFTVGSTKEEIHVEVCAACHPFFTGEAKYIDTLGRVEKFEAQRQKAAPGQIIKKKQKKLLKRLEEERKEAERPKSLKEMFERKH